MAGPKGTILHQLLAAALDKEGMSMNDVSFIQMGLPSGANALANGSVDAALLAGPAAYKALSSGSRMLKNGEGLVDATIVIATTEKFMKEYPKALSAFMETHKKTIAWMKKHEKEAKAMTARETGLPAAGVDAMYGWYDFDPTIRRADIEELVRTQKFMLDNGLQRKKIDDIRKLVK